PPSIRVGYHSGQLRSVAGRCDRPPTWPLLRQSKLRRRAPMMKTHAVKASEIERSWYVVDGDGQVLGRLASEVAQILRGKQKAIYAPHLDTGDFVVVVNASKFQLTGKKETQKQYYRHSGYPGGLRQENVAAVRARFPERIVERAIKGMLPHNALGRQMY